MSKTEPNKGQGPSQDVLIDEWLVDIPGNCEGLMVELGPANKVLVALKLDNEYEDCCFVFDLDTRSQHREKWFQPDWISQRQRLRMSMQKGIRDLSIGGHALRKVAALAANEGFGSCWEVGTDRGFTIDARWGVRSVAVHPDGDFVAVGTGKQVLDSKTESVAEVQLLSTGGGEPIEKRRLLGTCVVSMLWIHSREGLMDGYSLRRVEGVHLGVDHPCVVMEPGLLETVLVVTTESRNQQGGFVTLLDPQLMTILDIAEITNQRDLYGLSAWPESQMVCSGGCRRLDEFHNPWHPSVNVSSAPLKTASSAFGGRWLSDGRKFRFQRSESGAWLAQIWRATE